MTIHELNDKIRELETKFYNLKTKKAKDKVIDQIRVLSIQQCNLLQDIADRINGMTVTGTIIDRNVAKIEIDKVDYLIEVHPCNDILSKSWHDQTCCVSYSIGDTIKAVLVANVNDSGITLALSKIEGGWFDEFKYKELCNNGQKLAFFKYSDTENVTGLLA